MRQKRTIPFNITAMDSLGQGVSKISEKVTFIPKTAPGDQGEAIVMSEKKGVVFAKIVKVDRQSAKRIRPACIHYSSCPSCHYLHMNYQDELLYKKETLEKLFRKLPLPEVNVISAPDRLNYRNRIQLHYSLKTKLIGMRDPQTLTIIPIPECLIGLPQILNEINRLYQNDTWIREAPAAPMEGHVEVYWNDGQLKVSWNRPYAEGGFTQVYEVMNQKLKETLHSLWPLNSQNRVLDLFAGNGNLSSVLQYSKRLCVDVYHKPVSEEFLNQNLYAKESLKIVINELKTRNLVPDVLLVDPPRSGFRDLNLWIDALRPQKVAYVSCDPHTLVRDLQTVSGYNIVQAFLFDFFPSTFHFETLIFLERKD